MKKGYKKGGILGGRGQDEERCSRCCFLTSKGFITLGAITAAGDRLWNLDRSVIPPASRITMPFTAVSLYPNSNLPLRITLGAPEHNGSATMEVTADKENKYTHRHTPPHSRTNIRDVCVRNPSSHRVVKRERLFLQKFPKITFQPRQKLDRPLKSRPYSLCGPMRVEHACFPQINLSQRSCYLLNFLNVLKTKDKFCLLD